MRKDVQITVILIQFWIHLRLRNAYESLVCMGDTRAGRNGCSVVFNYFVRRFCDFFRVMQFPVHTFTVRVCCAAVLCFVSFFCLHTQNDNLLIAPPKHTRCVHPPCSMPANDERCGSRDRKNIFPGGDRTLDVNQNCLCVCVYFLPRLACNWIL